MTNFYVLAVIELFVDFILTILIPLLVNFVILSNII